MLINEVVMWRYRLTADERVRPITRQKRDWPEKKSKPQGYLVARLPIH
jgi:hypothetical protein